MISLTFDVDWAPEAAIQDSLDLLAAAGASATFFATHASPALQGAADRHEIGLHPNFLSGPPFEPTLDALQALFPEARGVRSHGLVQSSGLTEVYGRRGIQYESNIFAPGQYTLQPYRHPSGIIMVPFHWGDYTACRYGGPWDAGAILDVASGSLVFNFHPVHVFLNTPSIAHYDAARQHYQNPEKLMELRHTATRGTPGVRDFLLALLAVAADRHEPFQTLRDLAAAGHR
jgi:hypothetical protein